MVKRAGLRLQWLSACEGSNPFFRITNFIKRYLVEISTCELTRLVGVYTSTNMLKMKSKSKISKQTERKQNNELVKTILLTRKNKEWFKVAESLSSPRKKRVAINLDKINSLVKKGDLVVIPGKVLSKGEIEKDIKIVALSFSKKAEEKLKKADCDVLTILEEIKKNPKAKGIKIIK